MLIVNSMANANKKISFCKQNFFFFFLAFSDMWAGSAGICHNLLFSYDFEGTLFNPRTDSVVNSKLPFFILWVFWSMKEADVLVCNYVVCIGGGGGLWLEQWGETRPIQQHLHQRYGKGVPLAGVRTRAKLTKTIISVHGAIIPINFELVYNLWCCLSY